MRHIERNKFVKKGRGETTNIWENVEPTSAATTQKSYVNIIISLKLKEKALLLYTSFSTLSRTFED